MCITGVLAATGLRACVRACVFRLSVGRLLPLERRDVAFYELRCNISCAVCQCKGQHAEWRTP